jgi:hypothetical protein
VLDLHGSSFDVYQCGFNESEQRERIVEAH